MFAQEKDHFVKEGLFKLPMQHISGVCVCLGQLDGPNIYCVYTVT